MNEDCLSKYYLSNDGYVVGKVPLMTYTRLECGQTRWHFNELYFYEHVILVWLILNLPTLFFNVMDKVYYYV